MTIDRRKALGLIGATGALVTGPATASVPRFRGDDNGREQAAVLPDLLILGSPHLSNAGRDMVNARVDDVTTSKRQTEVRRLIDGLARYGPTRIAVEVQVKDQTNLSRRYAAFRAGSYEPSANEVDQIALPLAARANLAGIDAVDWNSAPPMAEADYDFMAWARANGRDAELAAFNEPLQAEARRREERMRCTSVGQWYRDLNAQAYRAADNARYFDIAQFGEAGPNWVGGSWYMRNLKIFAQLRRIAGPADRVLVLYGAGHAFLLDQFARQSHAFTITDPLAHLPPEEHCSVCAL